MLGLRTQEGKRFENYFALVQQEAKLLNCAFFIDCGEGRDFETDQLSGEDLSGWLIPIARVEQFAPLFEADNIPEEWMKFICFAEWSRENGEVKVNFHSY